MYREYIQVRYDECLEYVRKSRTDDPLLTLEEVLRKQEMELREFSSRVLGGVIPESQTYREVASSETIEGRPEFCKLLKAIESPKVKAVLVREEERLSRGDAYEMGLLMRAFRYTNTLIITPHETYDLRNESDRMILEMRLKSGNQYLEYTIKNMKRGKDLASMDGQFIARLEPFGFKKISYKEGGKDIKTLEIVEEEAKIIRLVFESYANQGMSMGQIAAMLNEMKVKKRTDTPWTRGSIAEMLMNPVYMGKIRWNYRVDVKAWEDKQITVSRPRRAIDEYMLVDGRHEAIISEELFYNANLRKAQNVPIKKDNTLRNPLAGIFYCAKCGKAMKLRPGDKRNKPRYECTDMKFCGNASASYEDIIEEICKALADNIEDFEVRITNDDAEDMAHHQQMIDAMEKRLVEIERKELSLWDKYAEEGMPKDIFDKLMGGVKKDKAELKESLAKAYASVPKHEDYEEKIYSFRRALEHIKDDSVSAQAKNTLLRAIIEKITYSREKGVILTKELAQEMGVPYTHPLCWHNYPFDLEITLRV